MQFVPVTSLSPRHFATNALCKMSDAQVHVAPQDLSSKVPVEQQDIFTKPHDQALPFDSPWEQTASSPASSRDFGSPGGLDWSGDHLVNQSKEDFDWLATADLFAPNEFAAQYNSLQLTQSSVSSSQQLADRQLQEFRQWLADHDEAICLERSQQSQHQEAPSQRKVASDLSFDSLLEHGPATSMPPIPDSQASVNINDGVVTSISSRSASPASSQTSNHSSEKAAAFLRTYASENPADDTFVLVRALAIAGVTLPDGLVQEVLQPLAGAVQRSPQAPVFGASQEHMDIASQRSYGSSSPSERVASPLGSYHKHDRQAEEHVPVSITTKPSNVAPAKKTCSSAKLSPRATLMGVNKFKESVGGRSVFICDQCNKHFERAYNLKTHRTTHIAADAREKPFNCPYGSCLRTFARKHDTMRHYQSVHVRKGEIATAEEIEAATGGRTNPTAEGELNT